MVLLLVYQVSDWGNGVVIKMGHRDSETSFQTSRSPDAKSKRNGKFGLPSQTENPISAETNVPAFEQGNKSARANSECL
jgi:hypothetical protein